MKSKISITAIFLILLGLAYLNTGVGALLNPEGIMSFVDVELNNPSAKSSIRAYYGAVNLFFGLFMVYGAFFARREALLINALISWGFVFGRTLSMVMDGRPNEFVTSWLTVESVAGVITILLLVRMYRRKENTARMAVA